MEFRLNGTEIMKSYGAFVRRDQIVGRDKGDILEFNGFAVEQTFHHREIQADYRLFSCIKSGLHTASFAYAAERSPREDDRSLALAFEVILDNLKGGHPVLNRRHERRTKIERALNPDRLRISV